MKMRVVLKNDKHLRILRIEQNIAIRSIFNRFNEYVELLSLFMDSYPLDSILPALRIQIKY